MGREHALRYPDADGPDPEGMGRGSCNVVNLLTPARLAELACAANAAPSADNRHPYRLGVERNLLGIWPAADFARPPAHRRILSLLSVGAAATNVKLRAKQLGLALVPVERQLLPDGAIIAFRAESAAGGLADTEWALADAIERRQSNRRLRYRGPKLAATEQAALSGLASDVHGASVEWFDSASRRRSLLRLLRAAESARFSSHVLHSELFDSIRFDVGWDASVDHGLPPGALGLPKAERAGFSLLKHWPVQRLGNLLGLHLLIGLRAADIPCRFAPHLVAVTTAGHTDDDALCAGQALQRLWLGAAAQGLATQVFAAPALYAHPQAVDVSAKLQTFLQGAWSALCPSRFPWCVLRVGIAPVSPVRAGRPPAERLWR